MKTKKLLLISLISIVILILVVLFIFIYNNYQKIVIDERTCQSLLFGKSPTDFIESKGKDTTIEGCYTYAKVDNNGNLVLFLSKKDIREWKNARIDMQVLQSVLGKERDIDVDININLEQNYIVGTLIEKADQCTVTVSEDFSKIIAFQDEDGLYATFLGPACFLQQLLDGKPANEIIVEYIQFDEDGNEVSKIVYPNFD